MLLEERLEVLCCNDDSRSDKLAQWQVIKQETVKRLRTVCTHFPHFSKHDSSHSVTIEEQIGKLLGSERINKLSCSDILILLSAFYLHDVGMALDYEDIYDKFTSTDFREKLEELSNDSDSELRMTARRLRGVSSVDMSYEHSIDVYNDVVEIIETLYRSEHAKRSSDAVKNHDGISRCFGIRCQNLLAEICNLHQKSIRDIMKLPYKENGLFGDFFHPRFIAAMLCLGDLMDLDTDRFDESSLRSVSPMPRISRLHLKKHESVTHYLVDMNEIRIQSNTDDIHVYNVMRQWLDWIQEACEYISLHWSEIAPSDFGNAPRLIERELLLNGEAIRAELANLRYQISGRRMYKLMEGGGIYRNKLVCIREILQNAVDATIYRLFDEGILAGKTEEILGAAEKINWDDYKIEGRIEKTDDTYVEVCLRDKGIGVSEEDIYKIAQVSNKKTEHIKTLLKDMPVWIRPSGVFGIGLQSIFLLTDEFTMITKTINEAPKEITFQSSSNGNGYIIVKKYEGRFAQGTEVRFTVDVSRMSAEELGCSNYYYRRKLLSNWFLKRAMLYYSNRLPPVPPIREISKKRKDTIPIELSITDFRTGKIVPLLKVETFLLSEEKEVDIDNGFIKTRMFYPELNCHLACNIILKGSDRHTYGRLEREYSYLHNTVLYRHEYVADDFLERSALENVPLLPYVDWRIDIMDGEADEILNLNRNTIREEYAQVFRKILLGSVKKSICRVIDYLLTDAGGTEKADKIGDTILLMYQFARQYGYKHEELYEKYRKLFHGISIDNYVKYGSTESVEIQFDELAGRNVYFVLSKIDEEVFDEEIRNKIKRFDGEEAKLFDLNKGEGVHILNHKAKNVSVVSVGDEYLEVVEAVPFEYSNPMRSGVAMDDVALLHQVIRMIKVCIRGLPVLAGYEMLASPVNEEGFSIRHYIKVKTFLIEMPFGEYQEKLYDDLVKNGYVPNACDRYLNNIVNSELYRENIRYIESYHESDKGLIEEKYKHLIEQVLNLLGNEKYKAYIKHVLPQYIDPRCAEYVFNGRDVLESNRYLAMVVSA